MFENKTLYKNYTQTSSGTKSIIARMMQREKWLRMYKENGSCEQLLIDAGILEVEENE